MLVDLRMHQLVLNKRRLVISNISVKDIVDFVNANKRGKAFEGWSNDDLAWAFYNGIGTKAAAISLSAQNEIVGVVLCEPAHDYKILHVIGIIAKTRDAFKSLMGKFVELYPEYDLQAYRRGNLIRYKNTKKLVSKVLRK
jgi:hypothetical protein